MTAYLIAEIEISDPATFQRYRDQVGSLIERHGGRYIVRGGETEVIEGGPKPARIVVIEFPSRAAFHAFYGDPDYQPVLALRLAASTSRLLVVDGVAAAPR